MKIDVFNTSGKKTGSVNLDNKVYKIEPNLGVIRQAVLGELSNMRQGTHSSKNRSSVRGGGKNLGNRKEEVLPELELFALRYGKGVVLFLVPLLTNIITK